MSHDTAHAAPRPRPRGTSGRRVAATAAGGILALLALVLVVAGGALLWGDAQKDDAGYVSTGPHGLHTRSYAIATDNLDIDLGTPGPVIDRDRLGHIRVEVTSRTGKPVFVGIAPTRDVSRYLVATAHASITDVDDGPFRSFRVTYRSTAATAGPPPRPSRTSGPRPRTAPARRR